MNSISWLTLGLWISWSAAIFSTLILIAIALKHRRRPIKSISLVWTCIIVALAGVLAGGIFSEKRDDIRYGQEVSGDLSTVYSSHATITSLDRPTNAISFDVAQTKDNQSVPKQHCTGTVVRYPGKLWYIAPESLSQDCQNALRANP